MYIKEVSENQLNLVQEIAHKTWPSAFKDILSPEQIRYMLEWMYDLETLREQMLHQGHIFLIIFSEGQPQAFAGYQINGRGEGITKLHKIYVLPEAQRKGAGRLLLYEVINRTKSAGQHTLSLNVNRANRAVDFYTSIGFKIARSEDISIGGGFFMNDYVMELELESFFL